jgi:hypothetical protein
VINIIIVKVKVLDNILDKILQIKQPTLKTDKVNNNQYELISIIHFNQIFYTKINNESRFITGSGTLKNEVIWDWFFVTLFESFCIVNIRFLKTVLQGCNIEKCKKYSILFSNLIFRIKPNNDKLRL